LPIASAVEGVQLVSIWRQSQSLGARPRTFHQVNYQGHVSRARGAARPASNASFTLDRIHPEELHARNGEASALIDEKRRARDRRCLGAYCRSKYLAEREALGAGQIRLAGRHRHPTMPVGPGDGLITPPTRMLIGFLNGATPAYLDCESTWSMHAMPPTAICSRRSAAGSASATILGGENLALGHVLDLLREMTGLPIARTRVPYALA